jgi:hypothetical protein
MKKNGTHLTLHRETLKRLDDTTLTFVPGGNLPSKPPFPSSPNTCTCTLFCDA